jgi:hypothetical protein
LDYIDDEMIVTVAASSIRLVYAIRMKGQYIVLLRIERDFGNTLCASCGARHHGLVVECVMAWIKVGDSEDQRLVKG